MSEIAKIVRSIIELIPQNTDPKTVLLIVLVILFIYGLHKANVIYDFWERLNERDITRLKKMLTDEYIPEEIKENIRREIRFVRCKQTDKTVTRITRNIYLQDEIITYYLLSKGRLRYPDFRKILGFLEISQNGILIIFFEFLEPVLSIYVADKIRNEVEMNELISQYKKKKLEARVPAEKIKKDDSFTVLDKIFKRSKRKKRARR